MTVDGCDIIVAFVDQGKGLSAFIREGSGMGARNIAIDDLLKYYLKLLTVEGHGKWSDELRDAYEAREYAAGLIIAMAACQDQNLKPDRSMLRAALTSPWCEPGLDADMIGHELLQRTEVHSAA